MQQITNEIEGPGLSRVIKESIDSRKQLVVVYDYDESGRIIRVGYFFEENELKKDVQPGIIWFKDGEVRIKPTIEKDPKNRIQGQFDISFKHPKANERHILIELPTYEGNQITLRNLFRIVDNNVTSFVIQVEIKSKNKRKSIQKPIIRYDCAHGFIHRDLIARNGKKTKETLNTQDVQTAISTAIDEIPYMLGQWLNKLGYREIIPVFLDQSRFIDDFDKVKATLLELIEDPKKMDEIDSRFIQFM